MISLQIGKMLGAMGIGTLPEAAFSTKPYCTDWLDTEASQKLLKYQRYTFDDIIADRKNARGNGHRHTARGGLFYQTILHRLAGYRGQSETSEVSTLHVR